MEKRNYSMTSSKVSHTDREFSGTASAQFSLFSQTDLCVPKTLSELMPGWNRLSWRNDWVALFRSGRPGLAIQVEVAASG
jgi:hypothetical protein